MLTPFAETQPFGYVAPPFAPRLLLLHGKPLVLLKPAVDEQPAGMAVLPLQEAPVVALYPFEEEQPAAKDWAFALEPMTAMPERMRANARTYAEIFFIKNVAN